ncbi:purine nucleoside permease [Calocera cornea HHB12733]|uniref:Purine nucleoside permease n=1 Tax=Calocera cornea HHB12733 TaxID=1353952 RepID=A0A165CJA2_9BASI|nr:purine nucleoside permease [Calocera cornea HHB12733]
MFAPEQDVWLEPLQLGVHNVSVPGLSPLYPGVRCDAKGWICQMTTGEAEINAATSTTALFFSDSFDFRKTYFLIAGIGGGNPYRVTTGSATFARFAIQSALGYEMDIREAPSNWTTGYWAFGTTAPLQYPGYSNWYGTEVFELNTNLLGRVMDLVKNVKLNDSSDAQAFRSQWPFAPANAYPTIVQCDTTTSDVWFTGTLMAEAMGNISSAWTNGTAKYCSTAEEDNATLMSALRATLAGRLDFGRFMLLRTIVNFDRPPPGLTTYQSLESNQQGFEIGLQNIFMAGWPVVKEIVYDWKNWEMGTAPPTNDTAYGDVLGVLRSNGTVPHGVGTDLNTTKRGY